MVRFVLFSLVSFVVIISCCGQFFQYSRGWTNGKRSSSLYHEEPTMAEIFDQGRQLEKCIIQLQRFIHNPFLIQQSHAAGSINGNSNILFPGGIRHQSNEIFDDLASSEPVEFSTKHA